MESRTIEFTELTHQLKQCTHCADILPLCPRPVFQLHPEAKLLIISQAPGKAAHDSGIAFMDPSGRRLRAWLGMDETRFYEPRNVAIMPMAFCYPGKGKSGDIPPPKACAPLWHPQILSHLQKVELRLLVGKHAIARYAPHLKNKTVAELSQKQDFATANTLVLPHPSPRNNIWLAKNPNFEATCVLQLQQRIATLFQE